MDDSLAHASARVAAQLGPLQREAAYQRALAAELRAVGCVVSVEHPVVVMYTPIDGVAVPVDSLRADLVVDGKAVVECKVALTVTADAKAQARRYATTLGLTPYVVAFRRSGGAVVVQC